MGVTIGLRLVVGLSAAVTAVVGCGGNDSDNGAVVTSGAAYATAAKADPKIRLEVSADGNALKRISIDMVTACRLEGGFAFGTFERQKAWRDDDDARPRIADDGGFSVDVKDGEDRIELEGTFRSDTVADGSLTVTTTASVPSTSGFGTEDVPCKVGPERWTARRS